MQYHKASHIGHERSRVAQMKLFDYTGFAMLTYTIKQGQNGFAPVGDEMLLAKIVREKQTMLFLCDIDGYAKAQSKPLPVEKANEIYLQMVSDGFMEYNGEIKTVS